MKVIGRVSSQDIENIL